jgi:hypothetical protein
MDAFDAVIKMEELLRPDSMKFYAEVINESLTDTLDYETGIINIIELLMPIYATKAGFHRETYNYEVVIASINQLVPFAYDKSKKFKYFHSFKGGPVNL